MVLYICCICGYMPSIVSWNISYKTLAKYGWFLIYAQYKNCGRKGEKARGWGWF